VNRVPAFVTVLLATAAMVAAPVLPVGARPAPGEITALPDVLPNYFLLHGPSSANQAIRSTIRATADPVTGRYFEFFQGTCDSRQKFNANAAVYDLRTYRLVGTGCVDNLPIGTVAGNGTVLRYATSTGLAVRAVTVAFDPVRHVFFTIANKPGAHTSSNDPTDNAVTQIAHGAVDPHQIAVFDQDTLKLLDVWDLPATAPENVSGLTYYAPTRELVVTTDSVQPHNGRSGAAVHVLSYDIDKTLRRSKGASATPVWDAPVASCVRPIQANAASIDAHHSLLRPVVYVPCSIAYTGHADHQPASYRSGVVTMTLKAGGSCPAGHECPVTGPGAEATAIAPTTLDGFVFDPGSDRAFSINNSATTGITVLGYDGPSNKFLGRTAVGTAADANNSSLGLDPNTGRLYGSGKAGLTTIDGRRAQLATGSTFGQFAGVTQNIDIVTLPPSKEHPYTRVLLPLHHCEGAKQDQACVLAQVTVLADRLPVTVDPPASALDSRTYSGPLKGVDASVSYSGDAAGFGAHVDWIGSAQTVVNNELNQDVRLGQQLAEGDRDLLAGYVEDVSLSETNRAATASSLGDGNGSTQRGFENATATPNPPSGAPTLPGAPTPTPSGSPDPVTTWPYRTVACGYPGTVGHDDSTDPATASVHVVCDATDKATAVAIHGAQSISGTGGPTVSIGASETSARVTPPAGAIGTSGIEATVTARVRGLHVDLGSAIGEIVIGEVSHTATAAATGRPDGAHTTYKEPVVSDVYLKVGGTVVDVCQVCPHLDTVMALINQTFPGYVAISRPQPDRELLKGSPGGYKAAVQADPNALYGDIQFNHMSPEEAALVPALRIVVYNDGNALSRVVIDVAGVKADANQGIQPRPTYTDDPTAPVVDVSRAREHALPPPLNGFRQHGDKYVPLPTTATILGRIGGAIVRALRGFAFLLRRPAELFSVLALLSLLLAPALLMARRRLWTREVFASPSG
jgi:hypothetical protein